MLIIPKALNQIFYVEHRGLRSFQCERPQAVCYDGLAPSLEDEARHRSQLPYTPALPESQASDNISHWKKFSRLWDTLSRDRTGYVRAFKHWPVDKQIAFLVDKGVSKRRIYEEGRGAETLDAAIRALHKGEVLEVVDLNALGNSRDSIAEAFGKLRAKGCGVLELTTEDAAFDPGITMFRRTLKKIHGRASSPSRKESQRRGRVGGQVAAERASIGRMPANDARRIWKDDTLTTAEAIEKINADERYEKKWSHATLYRKFGERGRPAGRTNALRRRTFLRKKATESGGMIYFCRADGKGPIKIGHSTDIDGRMASIQTGHHGELKAVAIIPGTLKDEKALHKQFAKYRIRGEWFKPSAVLLRYIAALPQDLM